MHKTNNPLKKLSEEEENEILQQMLNILNRAQRKVDDEVYRQNLERIKKKL